MICATLRNDEVEVIPVVRDEDDFEHLSLREQIMFIETDNFIFQQECEKRKQQRKEERRHPIRAKIKKMIERRKRYYYYA